MDQYNSRNADKFVVRLNEGQRLRIAQRARAEQCSMNDLCIRALDRYMQQSEAFDKALKLIEEGLKLESGELLEQA